ncbi:YunG family protein [Amycolatopsis carbonis]|uniref:YunG family protein n=1 Tax=Amycolatopsis carbonis TaxID=715471 RepID=UPI003DA74950
MAGGIDIDLTRDQFAADEVVSSGVVVPRQPKLKRLAAEYELLRSRVYTVLRDG